ncbi:hypothetical protein QTI66_31825 [Variovorax sp. J22R133]|uniref:DUF6788 family protein n=1 Tax=Variovorax brevis TaxID=3053503 RepID=UPI002575619C|nr:DUF6788 family protein [Variovorax sp. J22R133]MDM0116727.1 hypothetical protein [Variovorax sp. J22R133]
MLVEAAWALAQAPGPLSAFFQRISLKRGKQVAAVAHGPYYQVSYTRKGKSSTKFVKQKELPAARKQLKNYERMKLLTDRWIDLATELSTLRLNKEID